MQMGSPRRGRRSVRRDRRSVRTGRLSVSHDPESLRHDGQSVRCEGQSVRCEGQSVRCEGQSVGTDCGSVVTDGASVRTDWRSAGAGGPSVRTNCLDELLGRTCAWRITRSSYHLRDTRFTGPSYSHDRAIPSVFRVDDSICSGARCAFARSGAQRRLRKNPEFDLRFQRLARVFARRQDDSRTRARSAPGTCGRPHHTRAGRWLIDE